MLLSPLIVAALLFQGAVGRPYSEERQLLDRHLTQLSRPLPDGPTADDDAAVIRQLATEAGLRNLEIAAPTITETETLGLSRRPFTANATFPDTDRFFRAVQSSPRLIDVENLVLRSVDFGVRIEARLRFYHRPPRAVQGASLDPARLRNRTRGATREDALRFAKDEQKVLEKTIALDDLRKRQTSPRMFLAETGSAFRDAAAALSFGSLDGDTGRFTLRGAIAGMGAADALERRLEEGFFRLREFSRSPKDGCYLFEVVGESFRAGPQAALPLPVDEPFRATDAFCFKDRDEIPASAIGALRANGSEADGISLRAVDVDLADVAAMIESLTRAPFVVAEDVRGRVNVDFTGPSIDDALKTLPLHVDRVGTVRVIRSNNQNSMPVAPSEDAPPSGRWSFRSKRARGEDVLAALVEVEPSFAAQGPSGLAKVSIFARETPVGDLRRAVLVALQLQESREENARVLRIPDRSGEVGPIAATTAGELIFRARDLSVDELALAGLGRSGSETVAFVYSPLGDIVALRVGDTLADGVVATIDANGLLVDTSEGPVRNTLIVVRAK